MACPLQKRSELTWEFTFSGSPERLQIEWSSRVPHLSRSERRDFLTLVRVCDSRVGGGARVRLPPSAAQTAQTDLPYAAFAKTQRNQGAREGIKATKRTS